MSVQQYVEKRCHYSSNCLVHTNMVIPIPSGTIEGTLTGRYYDGALVGFYSKSFFKGNLLSRATLPYWKSFTQFSYFPYQHYSLHSQ